MGRRPKPMTLNGYLDEISYESGELKDKLLKCNQFIDAIKDYVPEDYENRIHFLLALDDLQGAINKLLNKLKDEK